MQDAIDIDQIEEEALRDGKETETKTIHVVVDDTFKFTNHWSDGGSGGDGLTILAPTKKLVERAQTTGDLYDLVCATLLNRQSLEHFCRPLTQQT